MRLSPFSVALLLALSMLSTASKAGEIEITPDVVYGHKHGMALTFDVFKPKQDANGAAILFMVSGGWYSSWTPPEQAQGMFKPLTDKGFTVFAIRHGSSPKFGIAEAVDDVRRGVRFIRLNSEKFQIDSNRMGVYGLSAGGHLSLMLGTTSDQGDEKSKDPVLKTSDRVAAVCAWVAPTDLRGMAWSNPDHNKMYDRFPALELDSKTAGLVSPLVSVTSDDAPSLLIAGDKDELVPIKHSYDIKAAFDREKVESKMVVIEGAGHGFQNDDAKKAITEMVNWFEAKLAKPSAK
ncbi:MAG: alpha/beta hydrolase [Planctomycetota bacterium]|nr:MAG: alpha/beta hydrolase [Planctomycetota bacterium]